MKKDISLLNLPHGRSRSFLAGNMVLLTGLLLCSVVVRFVSGAEGPPKKPLQLPDLFQQGGGIGEFRPVKKEAKLLVAAALRPSRVKAGDVVTLSVTVQLPPGAHIAPQKSDSDFGLPTKITVKKRQGLTAVDPVFRPTKKPTTTIDPLTGDKLVYFEGRVTWQRRYRVMKPAGSPTGKAASLKAEGTVRLQICVGNSCRPPEVHPFSASARLSAKKEVSAKRVSAKTVSGSARDMPGEVSPLSGSARSRPKVSPQKVSPQNVAVRAETEAEQQRHPFRFELTPTRRGKEDPIHLTFELKPADAQAGEEVTVSITAVLEEGWHAFALTHKKGGTGLPVEIHVLKLQGLQPAGEGWRPDKPPEPRKDISGKTVLEHHGTVTWSRTFRVKEGVAAGAYGLGGRFVYQICQASCLPPKRVSFQLGDLSRAEAAPAAASAIDPAPFSGGTAPAVTQNKHSLAVYLVFAFLGGLILNVMPCVLPVLAIKVMSFMHQAGEHRARVLMLNWVYAGGVISVFLLLASLAVSLNYGWGGLFQLAEFNIFMGVFVFAMGLSLLGVYEIPIPGFVGSAAGQQQREGPLGAFLTGVLATILATPCSGPFLGVTLAWSVKQTPDVVYLVWGTMGLGMGFPYLILGIFPKAIHWLPKPGTWMVRFKEFSGFVLMGTTIWIIRTLEQGELVYTLILLAGCGFALWMIGTLYNATSPPRPKWAVRSVALAVALFSLTAGSHAMKPQTDSDLLSFLQRTDVLAVSTALLGLSLAGAALQKVLAEETTTRQKWVFGTLAALPVVLAGVGAYFAFTIAAELPWEPYSEQRVNEELKKGNIVLIDFTADW